MRLGLGLGFEVGVNACLCLSVFMSVLGVSFVSTSMYLVSLCVLVGVLFRQQAIMTPSAAYSIATIFINWTVRTPIHYPPSPPPPPRAPSPCILVYCPSRFRTCHNLPIQAKVTGKTSSGQMTYSVSNYSLRRSFLAGRLFVYRRLFIAVCCVGKMLFVAFR